MRKTILSSNEYKQEPKTRVYNITAKPYQLDLLEEFLSVLQYCGNVGASRELCLSIDGDGAALFKIVRTDSKEKLCEHPEGNDKITDGEPVKLRGID